MIVIEYFDFSFSRSIFRSGLVYFVYSSLHNTNLRKSVKVAQALFFSGLISRLHHAILVCVERVVMSDTDAIDSLLVFICRDSLEVDGGKLVAHRIQSGGSQGLLRTARAE